MSTNIWIGPRPQEFAKYHAELAAPALVRLPIDAKSLVKKTRQAMARFHPQYEDDLPWPDGLQAGFELIDDLPYLSCVVFHESHWKPGIQDQTGWQFANFADQVIRERLRIVRPDRTPESLVYHVDMGLLYQHVRSQSVDFRAMRLAGWATFDTLRHVSNILPASEHMDKTAWAGNDWTTTVVERWPRIDQLCHRQDHQDWLTTLGKIHAMEGGP